MNCVNLQNKGCRSKAIDGSNMCQKCIFEEASFYAVIRSNMEETGVTYMEQGYISDRIDYNVEQVSPRETHPKKATVKDIMCAVCSIQ